PGYGEGDPLRRGAMALSRHFARRLQRADLAVDRGDHPVGARARHPQVRYWSSAMDSRVGESPLRSHRSRSVFGRTGYRFAVQENGVEQKPAPGSDSVKTRKKL